MLSAGDRAPEFLLASVQPTSLSLVEWTRNGPVLIVFVEADCPTSRMTLERLEVLKEPFAAAGATIVAIHQDSPRTALATMHECRSTVATVVEEPPYATADAYGVRTVPTSFLISDEGAVLGSVEGWSQRDFDEIVTVVSEATGHVLDVSVTADSPVMKPGCSSKNALQTMGASSASLKDAAFAFDELEDLFERGWTDGLPVVPPTTARVRRMLGDFDGSESLGPVPPGMGELTLERLAASAVMAGCKPEYFSTVKAAAEAALDPAFNVHGLTNTTHSCGPVVIINGPVREKIGMNSGINCLGGWDRANATIGRALRLMIGFTGHGAPPKLDRAALGQPGKISFCFAENEEGSPWESLAQTRGFAADDSVVTLYCGDAPFTVSDHYSRDPEDVVASIGMAGGAIFSPNFYPLATETVFIICREHAETFRRAGWSKEEVAERIFNTSAKRVSDLRSGEQGVFTAAMGDDEILHKWSSPDEVMIVVSGGPAGRFSAILPPWVGFGLGSKSVSRKIED